MGGGIHMIRVLIWANGIFLSGVAEGLRTLDAGLEVIAVEAGANVDLPTIIVSYRPEVIILESCKIRQDTGILAHLLTGFINLRVILIGCDDNWIQVYQNREFILSRTSDLVEVIHSS
jgi:hypothetical protein